MLPRLFTRKKPENISEIYGKDRVFRGYKFRQKKPEEISYEKREL